jgi:hypothetical protein
MLAQNLHAAYTPTASGSACHRPSCFVLKHLTHVTVAAVSIVLQPPFASPDGNQAQSTTSGTPSPTHSSQASPPGAAAANRSSTSSSSDTSPTDSGKRQWKHAPEHLKRRLVEQGAPSLEAAEAILSVNQLLWLPNIFAFLNDELRSLKVGPATSCCNVYVTFV